MATSSNVDQLFAQAIQFHNDGQLAQALQAYEQVLRLEPKHFEALHNTGIAAFQSGNFEMAAGFIRSALAVDPEHASAHNNLGNALREMQLNEEALRSYERALALNANDANTHFNRAVTLQSLMRSDEALQAYEQALTIDGGDDQAWANRATLLWQAKQYDQALVNAEQALALNPHNVEAHNMRGNIHYDSGRLEQAEESYRQALALFADYAEAHYNLGRLLAADGRQAEALASLEQAVSLHPQHVPAQRARAAVLRALQQPEQAQQVEDEALATQRLLIAAYRQRGAELEQLQHFESAASLYAAALELDQHDAELQQLYTRALDNTRQHDEMLAGLRHALKLKIERSTRDAPPELVESIDLEQHYASARVAFEKLTKLAPTNPTAYMNLGVVQQALGLREQAKANFERAVAFAPDSPLAHWNLSLVLLALGEYERGWQEYEWRWQTKELAMYKTRRHFLKPRWTGRESLQGKTILLYAEQGFGDALQFCRYASLVKQRGAKVIFEVWKNLAPLMESLADADQVVVTGQPLPAFDYHIPLMSLPMVFKTRIDNIPAMPSYLSSDAAKREEWAARLGPKNRLRVGVVWSGRETHGNDHNRSLPLSILAPLFALPCEFISLQKEVRASDQALLDTLPVRQIADDLNSYSDTAAVCDLLDVVITVDTSVAHLAGALGKRLWIMLPRPFEWRWFDQGDTSPWYPNASLYRQQHVGDWAPVIAAVSRDLQQLAGTPDTGLGRIQLHTS